MAEPHKVSKPRPSWWWRLRGIQNSTDCLELCKRCGRRGMAHYSLIWCWRFKRK